MLSILPVFKAYYIDYIYHYLFAMRLDPKNFSCVRCGNLLSCRY